MVAVKQEAQDMIQNLPDNCTYEDIQYHLYVVEKIKMELAVQKMVKFPHIKTQKREWLNGCQIRVLRRGS